MGRFVKSFLLLSCLCWPLADVAVTLAQPAGGQAASDGDGDGEQDYRTVIGRGLAEFEAGNWPEAIALFERAHAMSASARTLRGLALAHFENRQYVKALAYAREALESSVKPLTPKQRNQLKSLIKRAEPFVARFDVSVEPASATLTVDGYPPVVDEQGKVLLDPGEHEFRVDAEGFQSERQRVVIQPGRAGQLRFELLALAESEEPGEQLASPATAEPAASSEASGPGVGPWIVMGAGGAALLASAITGFMVADAENELEEAGCETDCATESYADTLDRGRTLQTATNVLLGVGLAAAAGGAIWWLLGQGEPESSGHARPSFSCSASYCGASLHARF